MTPQRFRRDQRRSIRRHTEEPSPDGHLSPWLWRPGYTAPAAQDGRRDAAAGVPTTSPQLPTLVAQWIEQLRNLSPTPSGNWPGCEQSTFGRVQVVSSSRLRRATQLYAGLVLYGSATPCCC